jgi:hypothetical protein
MVTGLMEKVAVQDFRPYTEREAPESRVDRGSGRSESFGRGDSLVSMSPAEVPTVARAEVPVEVVSKDFILGLLSLAIGRPLVLEGNLGTNVDVKV